MRESLTSHCRDRYKTGISRACPRFRGRFAALGIPVMFPNRAPCEASEDAVPGSVTQALNVGKDFCDLFGRGDELRHVRMAGRNTFGKCLFQRRKRITLVELAEGRCI